MLDSSPSQPVFGVSLIVVVLLVILVAWRPAQTHPPLDMTQRTDVVDLLIIYFAVCHRGESKKRWRMMRRRNEREEIGGDSVLSGVVLSFSCFLHF